MVAVHFHWPCGLLELQQSPVAQDGTSRSAVNEVNEVNRASESHECSEVKNSRQRNQKLARDIEKQTCHKTGHRGISRYEHSRKTVRANPTVTVPVSKTLIFDKFIFSFFLQFFGVGGKLILQGDVRWPFQSLGGYAGGAQQPPISASGARIIPPTA